MKSPKPTNYMTEEELVASALKGDEDAYRELFERYFPKIFRVALAYVGWRHDDAKDICQAAFIRAFERLDTLDEPGKFCAWVITITRRTALNHIKKLKKRAEVPLGIEQAIDNLLCVPPEDDERLAEMEREVIRDVVAMIPDDSIRETVRMFYVEGGLDTADIARRQGIPRSTVTSRLKRFRARYQRLIMMRILKLRGQL